MDIALTEDAKRWMKELSTVLLGMITFHERERSPAPIETDDALFLRELGTYEDTQFLRKRRTVRFGVGAGIGQMGTMLKVMNDDDLCISGFQAFNFLSLDSPQLRGLHAMHGKEGKQFLTLSDLDRIPLQPTIKRIYVCVDTNRTSSEIAEVSQRIYDWACRWSNHARNCTFVFIHWYESV